jgi:hypothetical protein
MDLLLLLVSASKLSSLRLVLSIYTCTLYALAYYTIYTLAAVTQQTAHSSCNTCQQLPMLVMRVFA